PGKEKRTEEIEITEAIKAEGVTRMAEVSEDELTQASAVIVDKAGNRSAPGADEVTLDTTPPDVVPTVTFTADKDNNGLLGKSESPGSTTEVKFTVPSNAQIGDKLVITIAEPGKEKRTEEIEITEAIKAEGVTRMAEVSEGKLTQASAVIIDKAGNISKPGADEVKPYQDIKVEIEVGPSKQVVIEDASKFANQMGLESKFYFVKSGEANIIHDGMNWGSEVNSVQEAKSYIEQREHDAEYKTNKIDFNPGSDLISNSDSIENSHLKKFLGNNASDLKITDNGEYVNQPDVTGTRAINKISGKVYLEAGKQYTFKANSDDGLEVIINGKKLFANHPNLERTHPVETAIDDTFPPVEKSGFYDISLVHYDIGWGYAVLQLFTVENGKDVAVGDYANGGLGLFNDTTGIRFDNGKFVKDTGMYETIITGELYKDNPGTPVNESNPELTFFKQSSDGSRVEIGKVTAGDNGEYSFKYESSQKPEQGDKFIVEYRDSKGNLLAEDITAQMHTGKMMQAEADVVKTDDMDADSNHNNSDDVKSQADNTKQLFSTDSSETIDISKVASLNSNPSSFESSNLAANHSQNPLNSLKQSDVFDEKDQNMLAAGTLKSDKADDATKANESVGNNQDTASNDAQAGTYIVPMPEQPTDIIS
ncbi:hypothetical protein ACPF04_08480, partial [Campylobacter sp. MOP51]|uniref:hypothetical protein n=1 Tax=Campylobacter canis TaxID=3378588 RepID=UPI003C3C786F